MSDILTFDDFKLQGVGEARLITLIDKRRTGNSLSIGAMEEISSTIESAGNKFLFITNEGATFCSGLDQWELLRALTRDGHCGAHLTKLKALYETVACHAPHSAAIVQGHTVGGGLGLALCCDAIVGQSGADVILPSGAYESLAKVLLPIIDHRRPHCDEYLQRVGWSIDADQAKQDGLFDDVEKAGVDPKTIVPRALSLAQKRRGPTGDLAANRRFSRLSPATLKAVADAQAEALVPNASRAIVLGLIYDRIIGPLEKALK